MRFRRLFLHRTESEVEHRLVRANRRVRDSRGRSLRVEPLEDRCLLSVDLQWTAGHTLALTEGTAGTTSGVTISEPSPSGNLLKIDLGAGYIFASTSVASATGLTYQNGSPNISQWATIDISLSGNVAALAATLPGDGLTLGPIYDLSGGIGSIAATAATIAVPGIDTSTVSGSVDLKATGDLTVASGATVTVGGGTLSLSADVQATGGGDDGSGTLSVLANAGAYAGTINLRGADVNIAPTTTIGRAFSDIPVTSLAGAAGQAGSADGTGSTARFYHSFGVAVDSTGNVYVADSGNHEIRKITPAGVVSTLAGAAGHIGSANGTGSAARFSNPTGVAVDCAGNVYVADSGNSEIRKITPAGVVTTLAGAAGREATPTARGAPPASIIPMAWRWTARGTSTWLTMATRRSARSRPPAWSPPWPAPPCKQAPPTARGVAARFCDPSGVAVDSAGNIYVADTENYEIRKITPAGVVTTLAGAAGQTGSTDGSGNAARFYFPAGVAVDSAGNVYVAD